MSYIGKSITNKTQIANQVIWIESNISEYQLDFKSISDNDILVFVNGKHYIPTFDFSIQKDRIKFINEEFPTNGIICIIHLQGEYQINKVSQGSVQLNHLSSELKTFDFQIINGNNNDYIFKLNFIPSSIFATLVNKNRISLIPQKDFIIIGDKIKFQELPAKDDEITVLNLGFKTTTIEYNISDNSIVNSKLVDGCIEKNKVSSHLIQELTCFEEIDNDLIIKDRESKKLLIDTTDKNIVIKLPENPSSGQTIEIIDSENMFDEHICIIETNNINQTINYKQNTIILCNKGIHCLFIYKEKQKDWKLIYYDVGFN